MRVSLLSRVLVLFGILPLGATCIGADTVKLPIRAVIIGLDAHAVPFTEIITGASVHGPPIIALVAMRSFGLALS